MWQVWTSRLGIFLPRRAAHVVGRPSGLTPAMGLRPSCCSLLPGASQVELGTASGFAPLVVWPGTSFRRSLSCWRLMLSLALPYEASLTGQSHTPQWLAELLPVASGVVAGTSLGDLDAALGDSFGGAGI